MQHSRPRQIHSALLIVLAASATLAADDFKGVAYSAPAGWATAEQDGALLLAPQEADAEAVVIVVLYPPKALAGQTFRAWLDAEMKANLGPGAVVLNEGEVQSAQAGGLETLTTARVVRDAEGAARLQMFHAVSNSPRAALAMGIAAGEKALEKHGGALQALFESLQLPAAGASADEGAAANPPAPSRSAATPAEGNGEPLPEAGVVNGVPQGLFVGVSVITGNPVFLLFLPRGRVYHNLPRGGLNRVDWAALVAENADSCGQWTASGGTLRIVWNDGNVWEGPLELTETGIRFFGKRYGRAIPARAQDLVGRWEGTRSTASLGAGLGATTQINTLIVDSAGRYAWQAEIGSDSGNAVAYGESATQGRLIIEGYDAIFEAADGSRERKSLLHLPGDTGFILDATYFLPK